MMQLKGVGVIWTELNLRERALTEDVCLPALFTFAIHFPAYTQSILQLVGFQACTQTYGKWADYRTRRSPYDVE